MRVQDVRQMSDLSLYPEAVRLKLGQKIAPRMAIVHLTNFCNQACLGCEYAAVHGTQAAKIATQRALDLMIEIMGLGAFSVLFSGGGEPTLHPGFCQVIEQAKACKLLLGLFTNGTNPASKIMQAIVQHVTFVRVSMDAAKPETYATIRQVDAADFWQVNKFVKQLVKQRQQTGSNLEIGLKFLVRQSNINEIIDFVNLAEELEVDNVQYKPLRWHPEEVPAECVENANYLITQAKKLASKVKVTGGIATAIQCQTPCWLSPLRVVISAEGDVHLCNYFHHRRATHTYGNIEQAPLNSLWYGVRHQEALTRIDSAECEHFDCRFHKLNTQLDSLVAEFRSVLDFV